MVEPVFRKGGVGACPGGTQALPDRGGAGILPMCRQSLVWIWKYRIRSLAPVVRREDLSLGGAYVGVWIVNNLL